MLQREGQLRPGTVLHSRGCDLPLSSSSLEAVTIKGQHPLQDFWITILKPELQVRVGKLKLPVLNYGTTDINS